MDELAATFTNVAARDGDLAEHVAESVEAVASFHRDHYRRASGLQRAIDAVTDRLGRPAAVIVLMASVCAWSGLAAWQGGGEVDQPSRRKP